MSSNFQELKDETCVHNLKLECLMYECKRRVKVIEKCEQMVRDAIDKLTNKQNRTIHSADLKQELFSGGKNG